MQIAASKVPYFADFMLPCLKVILSFSFLAFFKAILIIALSKSAAVTLKPFRARPMLWAPVPQAKSKTLLTLFFLKISVKKAFNSAVSVVPSSSK